MQWRYYFSPTVDKEFLIEIYQKLKRRIIFVKNYPFIALGCLRQPIGFIQFNLNQRSYIAVNIV